MKLKYFLLSLLFMLTLTTYGQEPADTASHRPQLRPYDMEYILMPMIAREAVPGELNEEILLDVSAVVNAIIAQNDMQPLFDPAEIKAEAFTRGDSRGIVYSFPGPYEMPLAKYGAIVFTSVTENNYYTLEATLCWDDDATDGSCWVLGKTEAPGIGGHSNFGSVPDCDSPEAFIDLLERMGKLNP